MSAIGIAGIIILLILSIWLVITFETPAQGQARVISLLDAAEARKKEREQHED